MRVLVAFDKFKDCLSAPEACKLATRALAQARPTADVDACPLTDGGEGFASILTAAAGGAWSRVAAQGPRGAPVPAGFGLVPVSRIPPAARSLLPPSLAPDATVALVDLATASGLALLTAAERDPWKTGTYGTGELLSAAADAGAGAIVLGIGGSATNELGLGALAALGLQSRDARGSAVTPIPARWSTIARFGGTIRPLPPLLIACDVTNPLLGPRGATAVYGPQKGLQSTEVARLDHETARLALMLCNHFGRPDSLMDLPGAGAAGGVGFGLMAAANAQMLPGFEFVARWLDLDCRIKAADLVLTGEGRYDDTSLHGKGPGAIVTRAIAAAKPVHVFAGAIARSPAIDGATLAGAAKSAPAMASRPTLHAISPADLPLPQALREAPDRLVAAITSVLS